MRLRPYSSLPFRTIKRIRDLIDARRRQRIARKRERMMRRIHGVIHVGVNVGQERDDYAARTFM
jgi:hypothetical protein